MDSLHERTVSLWIATAPETTYLPLPGEVAEAHRCADRRDRGGPVGLDRDRLHDGEGHIPPRTRLNRPRQRPRRGAGTPLRRGKPGGDRSSGTECDGRPVRGRLCCPALRGGGRGPEGRLPATASHLPPAG